MVTGRFFVHFFSMLPNRKFGTCLIGTGNPPRNENLPLLICSISTATTLQYNSPKLINYSLIQAITDEGVIYCVKTNEKSCYNAFVGLVSIGEPLPLLLVRTAFATEGGLSHRL